MNELIFFTHIALMAFLLLFALKKGKECLIAFVCLCSISANFFILKQIELFSLSVTSSDVYAIGAVFGLNLLQEFFDKKEAKKAVYISFFTLLAFLIFTQFHLKYLPSQADQTDASFARLLHLSPRIILSSLLVFYLSQRIDLFLFGLLKKAFREKWLGLRMLFSQTAAQLLDTLLFSFLALWGEVENLFHIIVLSFSIKCLIILLSSPFSLLAKRFQAKEATNG